MNSEFRTKEQQFRLKLLSLLECNSEVMVQLIDQPEIRLLSKTLGVFCKNLPLKDFFQDPPQFVINYVEKIPIEKFEKLYQICVWLVTEENHLRLRSNPEIDCIELVRSEG